MHNLVLKNTISRTFTFLIWMTNLERFWQEYHDRYNANWFSKGLSHNYRWRTLEKLYVNDFAKHTVNSFKYYFYNRYFLSNPGNRNPYIRILWGNSYFEYMSIWHATSSQMWVFLYVDDSCLVYQHKDFIGALKQYFTHYLYPIVILVITGLFKVNKSIYIA